MNQIREYMKDVPSPPSSDDSGLSDHSDSEFAERSYEPGPSSAPAPGWATEPSSEPAHGWATGPSSGPTRFDQSNLADEMEADMEDSEPDDRSIIDKLTGTNSSQFSSYMNTQPSQFSSYTNTQPLQFSSYTNTQPSQFSSYTDMQSSQPWPKQYEGNGEAEMTEAGDAPADYDNEAVMSDDTVNELSEQELYGDTTMKDEVSDFYIYDDQWASDLQGVPQDDTEMEHNGYSAQNFSYQPPQFPFPPNQFSSPAQQDGHQAQQVDTEMQEEDCQAQCCQAPMMREQPPSMDHQGPSMQAEAPILQHQGPLVQDEPTTMQCQPEPMEIVQSLQEQHAEQLKQKRQAGYRKLYNMPPSIPDHLTDQQKRQYVTLYRMRSLAVSYSQQLDKSGNTLCVEDVLYYEEMKRTIIIAAGLPSRLSLKRKVARARHTNTRLNRINRNRLATNGDAEDRPASNGDAEGRPASIGEAEDRPASNFPNPPQTSGKRKSDDDQTRYSSDGTYNNRDGASDGAKRARRDDVSYPSLPPTQTGKTAELYGGIAIGTKSTSDSKAKNTSKRPIAKLRRPAGSHGPTAPHPWESPKFPDRDSPTPATETVTAPKQNDFQLVKASGSETPATGSNGDNVSSQSSTSSFDYKPPTDTSGNPAQSSSSITANDATTIRAPAPSASSFKFTPTSTAISSDLSGSSANSAGSVNASGGSKPTGFSVPKFGATAGSDFMAQFGQSAKKTEEEDAKKEKAKRKAEEFDSEDDDEAEWEQKYEQEQQAKRQSIEEAKKADVCKFVPANVVAPAKQGPETAPQSSQLEETHTTASQAPKWPHPRFQFGPKPNASAVLVDSAKSGTDSSSSQPQIEKAPALFQSKPMQSTSGILSGAGQPETSSLPGASLPSSQPITENIFGYLSNQASDADNGKGNDDKSEESDEDEPTPPKKQVTDTSNSSSRSTSRSLFDRIETNPDGTPKREIPAPTETEAEKEPAHQSALPEKTRDSVTGLSSASEITKPSLFAPANGSKTSNIFGQPSNSSSTDLTWNKMRPIKFASVNNAPSLSVTAPSPAKSTSPEQNTGSFTGLFGSPKVDASPLPAKFSSSLFGAPPSSTPGAGFNFGGPSKPFGGLSAPSVFSSTATSRATSPGASTGAESANEGTEDDAPAEEQVDLAKARTGEEDEDVLFEKKAKAREHGMIPDTDQAGWTLRGVGILRVLRHRETSKARIVLRVESTGKIVLNSALLSNAQYKLAQEKSVMFMAGRGDGNLSKWMVTVGLAEDAARLADLLEENKSN